MREARVVRLRIARLIRNLVRRDRIDRDLDDEIRAHVEMLVEEKIAAGISEREARREARIELGGIDQVKENVREVRMGALLEQLSQDVHYGLRMMRKNPGFTLVVVLTLALGTGANTAIFSVVNGVLLRPLPYKDPSRLVMIWHDNAKTQKTQDWMGYQTFLDIRDQSKSFSGMSGVSPVWRFNLSTDDGPVALQGYWVSASFFSLLGKEPELGRAFTGEEDKQSGSPLVMISHRLWQTNFGSDPNILNKSIIIDNQSVQVVGVMPAGFRFLDDADLWAPLGQNPFIPRGPRGVRIVSVLGRLAPGATISRARAEVEAIDGRLAQAYPDTNQDLGATVLGLQEQIVGTVRAALLVLLAGVAFVLLIACANVANLLVARAAAREREMSVRAALGAGRWRLVRQLLTESELLGFTLGASLLAGLLFGLMPAIHVLKTNLRESLKEGGRSALLHGGSRKVLIVSEVALALMMLIGAGLALRSFEKLMNVNPGFNPEHVLTMQIDLPPSYVSGSDRRAAFYRELFSRIEVLPGVKAVGGVTRLPLGPGVTTKIEIEGRPVSAGQEPELEFRRASDHYFEAMEIALKSGRVFNEQDIPTSAPAVIVNQTAAERFWPNENPLGRRVRFASDSSAPWSTIVGVVADVKHFGLDRPAPPEMYIAFNQGPPGGPVIAIRTSTDPASIISAVRHEVRSLDKQTGISKVAPMDKIVSDSTSQRRFQMFLLAAFAIVALSLAAVGIYGVMSYAVAQRTHEIGIRMALGAGRGEVFRLVVGQGMRLASAGIALGLVGAFAVTRFMQTLLFEVKPADPLTFGGVAILLGTVAFIACYVPARRAARVDPMIALRCE